MSNSIWEGSLRYSFSTKSSCLTTRNIMITQWSYTTPHLSLKTLQLLSPGAFKHLITITMSPNSHNVTAEMKRRTIWKITQDSCGTAKKMKVSPANQDKHKFPLCLLALTSAPAQLRARGKREKLYMIKSPRKNLSKTKSTERTIRSWNQLTALFVKTQVSSQIKTCNSWYWSKDKASIQWIIMTIQTRMTSADHFINISIHVHSSKKLRFPPSAAPHCQINHCSHIKEIWYKECTRTLISII